MYLSAVVAVATVVAGRPAAVAGCPCVRNCYDSWEWLKAAVPSSRPGKTHHSIYNLKIVEDVNYY